MTNELKPCPFCGGKPIITDTAEHRQIICYSDANYDGEFVYHCCEVENSDYDKAVEAWNTRKEPDELPSWVKNAIENEVGQNLNKRSQLFYCGFVQALNWVLTLRKPEEK